MFKQVRARGSSNLSMDKMQSMDALRISNAATGGVLWKKEVLEISQNSQENTCARATFIIKLLNFIKKKDSGKGVFPWILWKFKEHLFNRTPLDDCLKREFFSYQTMNCRTVVFLLKKIYSSLLTHLFSLHPFSNPWALI